MNSKLVILADRKPITLDEEFSISVELNNPLFNETEIFSYPVALPLDGNRCFLKNMDDPNSDLRPISYEHTPMQIIAEGVPFASGTAVLQEDEVVEDSLSMNIDASTQSFQDLISDLQCNEVKIPERYHDQLLIGEKIDEVKVDLEYFTNVKIKYDGKKGNKKYASVGKSKLSSTVSPQALGFSFPAKCKETGSRHEAVKKSEPLKYPNDISVNVPEVVTSYINVSDPYPIKPYCNTRICYGHHDLAEDGTTSDSYVKNLTENSMHEDFGPLWVLEADRPQSGICFYVLFFLDCLFEYLGVSFDKSALTAVGDFNRLCFFTTKCAYDTKPLYYGSAYTESDPEVQAGVKNVGDIKTGFFTKEVSSKRDDQEVDFSKLFDDVNAWLNSRGCGGKLKLENPKSKSVQQVRARKVIYTVYDDSTCQMVQELGPPKTYTVGKDGIASLTAKSGITKAKMEASIVQMFANEKNFPEGSVSTVIESLEQQFGIKFHYDYEQKKVTAYLIRDVFRKQNAEPRTFHAQIHDIVPISEKITGVRVGYSEESDAKEQKRFVVNEVKDFNTDYDYIDFEKNRTVTNMVYSDIIHQVNESQEKLFIDLNTGNRYRVKIDADFKDIQSMDPKLFEVSQYHGVEFGDCSSVNDDFVVEMKSDFVPLGLVDVNYRKALLASSGSTFVTEASEQPTQPGTYEGMEIMGVNELYAQNIFAPLYSDKEMEHEFVEQAVRTNMSTNVADFYVTQVLKLRESYNPSDTDDGNSPLQSYDWGLSITIMRGGGSDSTTESYDYNYDGFGNSKWRTTVKDYTIANDTIDNYGNFYDYNGTMTGLGNEERFSLKPRAWVQPEWADAPLVVNDPLVKNRGYVDTFLSDYIYFILNRKKYRIRCTTSVAQIVDIQNHWKEWWNIDGKKCLINKVSTDITTKDGMGVVELEVYSI